MTTNDLIWILISDGIAIAYVLWLGYLSNRDRRERLLSWRRTDTRGAKIFRVMFPRLDWEPLYFPKTPSTWKDYCGIAGILAVPILASVSIGRWGDKWAWMQSRNPTPVAQMFALVVILLIFLGPVNPPRSWPSTLTKKLIEELYRPQIERLREIASHFSRYMSELDREGGAIDNDLKLFSIPSVYFASVETHSPGEPRPVGGPYAYSLTPHAPRIVATSQSSPQNPQMSDEETVLIPGWVKFGDSSRRSSVIYKAALIDDKGEKRCFALILNLKAVINQIAASPHSTRCP